LALISLPVLVIDLVSSIILVALNSAAVVKVWRQSE